MRRLFAADCRLPSAICILLALASAVSAATLDAATWKAEIAKALAVREKLRRAHNAMGATVVDGKGNLRPDRAEAWRRYRAEQFLPASRRIEARICELRDAVPDAVKAQARGIVKAGKLALPAGAAWAERMALLEAASIVFGPGDAESLVIVPANCKEAVEPTQEHLDAADISPTGAKVELPLDPTENFTTYTELDTAGRYAVLAGTITVTGLTRQDGEDERVYKDFTANHFDGFSHNLDYKTTALTGAGCGCAWAIANSIHSNNYWYGNALLALSVFPIGTNLYVSNRESQAYSSQAITTGTQYYLTISRAAAGTTLTLYVYDDAARTSLVASKSVTVTAGNKYRYLFAANGNNDGLAGTAISAVIANLDIGEAGGGTIIPIIEHHRRQQEN
jgi:hypothetical protein